jgi:hypothetical protein
MQTITDSGNQKHEYEFVDVNFDDFKDLKLENDPEEFPESSSIWLFVPQKGVFEYSSEFSGFGELAIDKENKTLTRRADFRGGYANTVYSIENGHLKIIESETLSWFDYEKDSLVAGQLTRVAEDKIIGSELDSQFVLVSKRWILDSLRIVEENVMSMLDSASTQTQLNHIVAGEFLRGYYRYLQEEIYDYRRDSSGVVKVYKTIRRVVNDEWEDVPNLPNGLDD